MTRSHTFFVTRVIFHGIYKPHLYSSIHKHLGCFHISAIVNNPAINIVVHITFQISVFIFFGKIPSSGITESYGIPIFHFFRKFCTIFHNTLPPAVYKVPFSPHPYPRLLSLVFDLGHSEQDEVISHRGFNLQFPDD